MVKIQIQANSMIEATFILGRYGVNSSFTHIENIKRLGKDSQTHKYSYEFDVK